jgi:general secretion pathway protein G
MKNRTVRAAARGMTLIEIMVVMVILGLIAAAIAYNVVGVAGEQRVKIAKGDVHTVAQAIDYFKALKGRYPTTEEGLKVLLDEKILKPNNDKGTFLDPWGHEYVYLCPGQVHPDAYDVRSNGADGKPGGSGEDADVVSY